MQVVILLANLAAPVGRHLVAADGRREVRQQDQLLGAHRQFVFGEDARQRLPEAAPLCSSLLMYLPAISAHQPQRPLHPHRPRGPDRPL